MTAVLLIVLAPTHLEDANLVVIAVAHHGCSDARARHPGRTDLQIRTLANGQYLIDDDLLAHFRSDLLNLDVLAGGNLVLLAAGFYDRVHI
jgi:hypothetical protein